jgi:hypothetical protein
MLHIVIPGVVVVDAIVGGFAFVTADRLALEFGLELGKVPDRLLRGC